MISKPKCVWNIDEWKFYRKVKKIKNPNISIKLKPGSVMAPVFAVSLIFY